MLIEPKPGRAIVAIDYSQQEFLIAGILAGDKNMIKAYRSGDVYLYTGKLDGSIPKDGTKETHGELRSRFKSTVLGIQYGMGHHALARKITEDTGKETTPEEAQVMVDSFDQTYPDYAFFRVQIREQYENQGYLRLGCGWTMWGDNGNARSVSNFPVQGAGASIMRDAVGLAQDQGLDVILTLHDAIYVECEDYEVEWAVTTLGECMSVAFNRYFKDSTLQAYAQCRMDPTIWGPGLGGRVIETQVFKTKCYDRYIDPDAIEDYERYKNYLH